MLTPVTFLSLLQQRAYLPRLACRAHRWVKLMIIFFPSSSVYAIFHDYKIYSVVFSFEVGVGILSLFSMTQV